MGTDRVRAVSSRSGHAGVEVGGLSYHSPYDPAAEARKFYTGLPLAEADIVIQFGWGFGYAGPVLAERIPPGCRVFVIEPDGEVADLYRSAVALPARSTEAPVPVPDDPRFVFFTGSRPEQFLDAIGSTCQETDRILWIDWPRAVQMTGDLSASLQTSFRERLRDRAANLLTHFQNGELYFENAMANARYAGDPAAGVLYGQFRNDPLVLVSAGPSLDRNVHQLRGMGSRAFVLAVDTALRPLLAAGVVPHAVVIADPTALNARHVAGAVPPETYLIAEQAVHPTAMAAAKKRFRFSVGVFPDSLYAEFGRAPSRLDVWGSVATAALDLACRMGADPVVFIGQDFAYTGGRDYASHTIFDGRRFDPGACGRSASDIWGRETPTTENLVAYRDHFLRRTGEARGVRFINATEGGILHGGVIEQLSLRDAMHRIRDRRVDVGSRLARLHVVGDPPAELASHLAGVLRERRRGCGCLDAFLDLVAKEAVLKGDADAVDRAIARGIACIMRECC